MKKSFQNSPNRDTTIGAFVMMIIGGLFFMSYGVEESGASQHLGTYGVTAVFSRVDGLFEGDDVRLSGVRIGQVGTQTLDSNFQAVVTLNLLNGVKLPIDSAAAIHTDGLFGSKTVVMEPGIEEMFLQPGDSIEYTQGAVVVGELLSLIIDEGRAKLAAANKQKGN